MYKHRRLVFSLLVILSMSVNAQQSLYGGAEIVSPEIHADHTVTFRVQAPGAEEVKLMGDWMPAEGWIPQLF
jgi:enterochelin esterase family protein